MNVGVLSDDEITLFRSHLPVRAALEAFVETFHAMTSVRNIGLFGNDNPGVVRQLFGEVEANLPIKILNPTNLENLRDKDAYLVLSGTPEQRESLICAGFPAGQVWAEGDLLRQYAA